MGLPWDCRDYNGMPWDCHGFMALSLGRHAFMTLSCSVMALSWSCHELPCDAMGLSWWRHVMAMELPRLHGAAMEIPRECYGTVMGLALCHRMPRSCHMICHGAVMEESFDAIRCHGTGTGMASCHYHGTATALPWDFHGISHETTMGLQWDVMGFP